MSDRLPISIAVGALLRRVNDAGGMAMVRARGDAQAGAVLVLIDEGSIVRAVERGIGAAGKAALIEAWRAQDDGDSVEDYWRRRRARDPDLWVIELSIPPSIPAAERFIVETLLVD